MESVIHLSNKGQVVIPQQIRHELHLKQGDCFKIWIEQDKIILKPMERYGKRLLGLGKELWQEVDAKEYLRKERNSWEKKH